MMNWTGARRLTRVHLERLFAGVDPFVFARHGLWVVLMLGVATVQAQDLRRPAAPQYDVVALRVEFQPDTTRFTTGTGLFDTALYDTLEASVDPLPHDAPYFEARLDFLEDYVARVSDGRTQLTTHLLPEVVQVSQPMGAYSPTGFDSDGPEERAKLAQLVEEAWRLAGEQSAFDLSRFDPSTTAFVIFHAGVGRDLELTGTVLDRTPEDLPSLYFDEAQFQRLLRTVPDYRGTAVRNTILLPRTETRKGFNFISDEEFLIELSINGLFAASFFNFLGVPDLFNTETGESAIGPFGLMDPLGLFAFNGLLPPEPMAWTKVFLGWTEPVILDDPGPLVVTLNAASQPGRSDVVLVPISEAEYFLVENRYRDPEADGLILRVWRDGVVREQRVQNGDTTFNSVDISGFEGGVVVGADNYDWALPGGVDEDENPLNGGILIWHIDERIIAEALSTNRINADPDRRGIDLEEADGAQDLGFPTQGFGPDFSVGTPFDFWYEDNPVAVLTTTGQEVRLYQNRFGPDTTPSSNTNAGSPSYRILEGFSAPGPSMKVRYVRGPDGITDAVVPLLDTNLAAQVALDESSAVFDQTVRLTALPDRPNELTLLAPSGGLQLRVDTRRGEVVESQQGGTAFATVEGGRLVTLIDVEGQTGVAFGRPDGSLGQPVIIPRPFEWQPPLVGLGDGRVIARSQDGQELLTIQEPGVFTFERVGPILGLTRGAAPGTWFQVQPEGITERGGTRSWSLATPLQEPVGQPVFGMDRQGVMGVIPLLESRQLLLVADGKEPQFVPLEAYVSIPSALDALPVLADLNRDGRLDVVVTLGTTLLALDRGGALLDGFPLPLPAQAEGQPLVTAGTQEAGSVVFVPTERGQLYAYPVLGATDASARTRIRVGDALVDQLPGFPLSIGRGLAGTPRFDGEVLTAVTTAGQLRQWAVPSAGAVRWGTRNGDDANASFITLADEGPEPPARLALLDEAGTYNWPNPITNGQTFIRVLPGADGAVEIDIFDLAGQRVDQVHLPTVQAGVPAEVAWQTSASSGVYMARVKLTTLDGQEAVELIKMAIIR